MQPPLGMAPVYDALCHLQTEVISFHTPGHKRGKRGSDLLAGWLPDALSFDLTEIGGLDSIYHPGAALLASERLTAALYGAKETYFTTNGSTAGVIGSLLAATKPGDEVIVPRNAHISILSAIILGDLVPRFMLPLGQANRLLGVTPAQLSKAISRFPNASAVLLVSPSYEGSVGETAQLVDLAHAAGCLVVVDEAHGAHLPFHPQLPFSAVRSEADLVVQSAHKTLSALTGGAWVHRVTDRLSGERVRSCLNLVQSTSPSWLILASLDLARLELAEQGEVLLEQVLANAAYLREAITEIGFNVWDATSTVGFRQDQLKINLISSDRGISGAELATELASRGVYPELVSPDGVLLMLGLGDVQNEYGAFLEALRSWPVRSPTKQASLGLPPFPDQLDLRPRAAYFSPSQLVALQAAAGRVAARPIYAYPPGIPLVYPGERITQELCAYAMALQERGGDLTGVKGGLVAVVE